MHHVILAMKQTTLAACLTLQVDSFALRTRVSASPVKQGFTLAELLIALALLGIIAAFTIPKVLQSSATQETNAKLRETVATLETAWYTIRAQNQVQNGAWLYTPIKNSVNAVAADELSVVAAGAALGSVAATHPCRLNSIDIGWVQFPNGVVVTGLSGMASTLDLLSPMDPSHTFSKNYELCIDVNGAAGPNLPGQDVFFGNFNQYGGFQGPPANEQATLKSFRWGNSGSAADSDILDETGAILTLVGFGAVGDGSANPCAVVGCRLTQ